jgi:hypothetical protein
VHQTFAAREELHERSEVLDGHDLGPVDLSDLQGFAGTFAFATSRGVATTSTALTATATVGATVSTTAAAITAPALPAASAAPCPDIEVIYARSTGGVGLGDVGQAFVDAVCARAGGRSVDAYSVNYPASFDFANSVPIGAADAAGRVSAACPMPPVTLGQRCSARRRRRPH